MLIQACFAGTHSVATGAMFWGVNGIGLSLVSLQRHSSTECPCSGRHFAMVSTFC